MSFPATNAGPGPERSGQLPVRADGAALGAAKNKSPVTILMVDDQPAKLLAYETILKELGEDLITAATGREALEHLLRRDVAIVLMDVSMPEIDGFELADMMRQHPRFQKIPIIFVSAVHLSEIDRIRGYQSGAVDYISVPVVPEVLRAKVSVFAELHRKTRELQDLNRELEERVAERSEELRQLNSQLQERVAELESIMRVLPVGVAVAHDPECQLITGNAALSEMAGVGTGENLSATSRGDLGYKMYRGGELLRAEDLPIQRAAFTGVPTGLSEIELDSGNGQIHTLLASASPLFDEAGLVRGAVGAFLEVTDRKQMEEALRRSDRLAAMGKVAGIVAHEINNPLAAITNTFYLLRTHPSLDEQAQYYAELAEQELTRVSHIAKQTLSFYRESQPAAQAPLADLLDSVLDLQQRLLQMNRIRLEKRYSEKESGLQFSVEMKQVVLNLIGNAIQAMPQGGRLRVRVGPATDFDGRSTGVRVTITDSGVGVKPEDARRLFEPFFTTKDAKGTGLGLWISRGIVQKYDGTLRFRSVFRNGHAATCFQMILPA